MVILVLGTQVLAQERSQTHDLETLPDAYERHLRLALPPTKASAVQLRRRDSMKLFSTLLASGLYPDGFSLEGFRNGSFTSIDPLASSALGASLALNLRKAFPIAVGQVRQLHACMGMFTTLGADGLVLLATTIYLPALPEQRQTICARGVVAFTFVGGSVTWLCPAFARLPRTKAALILIHEALHYGGLLEYPLESRAPSPAEINAVVAARCNF